MNSKLKQKYNNNDRIRGRIARINIRKACEADQIESEMIKKLKTLERQ